MDAVRRAAAGESFLNPRLGARLAAEPVPGPPDDLSEREVDVLAPLAGVTIGLESWATAQFGIGLLLWPVLQTMLIIRMVQAGPLAARMSPSIFITMVAPSIIGLCFLQLDAPLSLAWGSWGIGLFFLMLSLTQIRTIFEQPFGLPHWAMKIGRASCRERVSSPV